MFCPQPPVQWQTVCEVQVQLDCADSLSTTMPDRLFICAHSTALATASVSFQLRLISARLLTMPRGWTPRPSACTSARLAVMFWPPK